MRHPQVESGCVCVCVCVGGGGDVPKKTRYFDPKTCSQCIVVVAPYPSSLGGVYQPVKTQRETPLPMDPYH